ncbi:MAG: class I SAM-dependent methyltransferase [Winogradskyella sp.]|uniref:class I SAM-dependent methyltransferase n=1 Tax=Winogradskyella sp. TaxID=1883156 RepID=UPI0017ACD54F|nr:class I SAM-dependent methyltransferase [Winogradskyella sp.]MBT8245430.1 class I SAM-dependent methyltransferase [Winogradskyella sp.]NNK22773.1 class I SAM-dependent methyltransferase [Winogradskyella sp.]
MVKPQTFITLKDYSVSGEEFDLVYNQYNDILETFPQPDSEKLQEYYKSEDYISHTDTKRNLLEQVYHLIRKIALKRKLNLINSFLSNKRNLLDVGCGTGDFLKIAKENNWNVSGIEPNADARKTANTKTNNSVFDTSKLLEFEPNSFDVITLWHVLEHLPNLEEHIEIFNRLLKPKGHLVIAVPNYKSYDAKYYKSSWAAYDVPRHLWHFSQDGIKNLVETFSFDFQKTLPMIFDSFYVSLLSEKYKRGFMNPIKAFWIGLSSNFKAKRSGEYSSLIYIFKKHQNAK